MKHRQNHAFIDRIANKPDKGLAQLEAYFKQLLKQQENDKVESLFNYFIFRSYHPNLSTQQKIALIQGLECIVFLISDKQPLLSSIHQLVSPILAFLHDSLQRIRFVSISTLYEIFTCLGDNCLPVFTKVFKELIYLTIDVSSDVRQASAHLSHTMKALLNDAILDHQVFDIKEFIDVLTQNFMLSNPLIKQFLIDWINAVDEITQFEVSFYLPRFLKQLFNLSIHQNDVVRNKTIECLKGFILGFRQVYKTRKDLSIKISQLDAQKIMDILLQVLIQNVSVHINIHALQWIEQFSEFLSDECNNSNKPFLRKIFSAKFQNILVTILNFISHQNEKIVALSIKINKQLLEIFAKIQNINPGTVLMLPVILKQSKNLLKIQAVIKWIKLLIQQNNQSIITQINNIVEKIIQKICDQDTQNIKTIIGLLKNSIFTYDFYDLLIEVLLSYIYQHPYLLSVDKIFRQMISLSNANLNYLVICRRLVTFQNPVFQFQMADYLINILVTEDSLSGIRRELIHDKSLFKQLYSIFCCNQPALICLSFMAQLYDLVYHLLNQFSILERIQDVKISSFIKIANLIQSPNMNQLKFKLSKNSPQSFSLRRAYIGLILTLPSGKSTKVLMKRLQGIQQCDDQNIPLQAQQCQYPERKTLLQYIKIYIDQVNNIEKIENV